ncbi:hypothetical protein QBK99_12600 [Corticibacterium sp. UT-5YL-CI-8]|nr:hypothetical protein [Tianweitania sp. UT-5YL-CI-8]
MNQFHVGMQVVCIDDKVPLAGGSTVKDANITEGQIYSVRWVGMAHLYTIGDYLGVKLEGVDSKFGGVWGVPDAPYSARRFRPLVSDPLAWARQIAADPNGALPDAPEGPKRKVREEVTV